MLGVVFIEGIGLGRDQLFQDMGMLFNASEIAFTFAVGENVPLSVELDIV